jgi:WD40 repeat protein
LLPLMRQVLWLWCSHAAAAAAVGIQSTADVIGITCLHQQKLPLAPYWVLDVALLPLTSTAAAASRTTAAAADITAGCNAPPHQQQQQQQQQAASVCPALLPGCQVLVMLMDNSVQVWHLQQQQQQQQRTMCVACVAHAHCSSRTFLYSGALLPLLPPLLSPCEQTTAHGSGITGKPAASPAATAAPDGHLHQQQQQQQVFVAAGTAFGDIFVWQLPQAALHPSSRDKSAAAAALFSSSSSGCPQHYHGVPVLLKLCGHEGSIHRLTWGPATAAAAGADETANGTPAGVATTSSSSSSSSSSRESAGQLLVWLGSCSDDRSARLWKVPLSSSTHHQQQQQQQQQQEDHSLAILSDQPAAAAAAAAAEAQLQCTLQASVTLWGHSARVWDMAFLGDQQLCSISNSSSSSSSSSSRDDALGSGSSGGLLVATGSEDCSCCLWDAQTGQQAAVLKVWSVCVCL